MSDTQEIKSEEKRAKYWAFISYSSKDRRWGDWLRKRIENYTVPKDLRGYKLSDGTVLGKHLRPVFRDRDELPGADNLGEKIYAALSDSRYLIVLCSPHTAQSKWVNKEITEFQGMGKGKNIRALILNGEPNSSDPTTECFPPALRHPAEPIAGDLRKEGDGKDRAFLKILAGIAQLDFDKIYRRHERARRKRLGFLAALSISIIASLSALTIIAVIQTQVANTQRSLAETNAQLANEQRVVANDRARQLSIDLSNKHLRGGIESLNDGKIEEGLALLTLSLRVWEENGYARDRLLFELFHREWIFPTTVTRFPHQLLYNEYLPLDKNIFLTTNIELSVLEDGTVAIVEKVEPYNYETDEGRAVSRKTTWNPDRGWQSDPKKADKPQGLRFGVSGHRISINHRQFIEVEPIEGPTGFADIRMMKDGKQSQFWDYSWDEKKIAVTPFGVPAVSEDSTVIAIAGLQPPVPTDDFEGYKDTGAVHISFFRSDSFEPSDVFPSFQVPVGGDADILRTWFQGKTLAIHSSRDGRDFDRFDWIDFSGNYPEFIIKNRVIRAPVWTFQKGKHFQLSEYESDQGALEIYLEVYEKKPQANYYADQVARISEQDIVFFANQLASGKAEPDNGISSWEGLKESSYFRFFDYQNTRANSVSWSRGFRYAEGFLSFESVHPHR